MKRGQEEEDAGKEGGRELAHGSKRAMPTEREREHSWVYAGGGGAGESLEGCVYVSVRVYARMWLCFLCVQYAKVGLPYSIFPSART